MNVRMNPATSVIDLIGAEKVSELTGKHISRVYRWMKPTGAQQGTGGIIPHSDALKLLAYSREVGLGLTEAHFLREPSIVCAAEEQGAA